MASLYDLSMIARITVKNIWRNRRRSLLTIIGIAVGTIALVLLSGYVKTMEIGLKDQAIRKEYAHFQIARRGYFEADSNSFDYLIPEAEWSKVEEKLLSMDSVDMVNKRLFIVGIIGNFRNSTIFSAVCGDPATEIFMAPDVVEGFPLSTEDASGIVIGQNMAKRLSVAPSDELLLFFTSESGSQEAILATLSGTYKGVMAEQEKIMIYLPIEAAWNLMLDKTVHSILVFLGDVEDTAPAMAELEAFFEAEGLDLEMRTWEELASYFKQIIDLFKGMIIFGGAIIFFVIVFGISNTMYMVISERTREIGTIRALGKSRGEVIALFIAEGVCLGAIGALVGVALSFALIPTINALHIMLPPGPGQSEPIPVTITANLGVMYIVAVADVLTAALASVLPSVSIARRKIADSLREI